MSVIFTIGHSNNSVDSLLELLAKHNIQIVIDVRSAPYSRYVPWFNKKEIQTVLRENNLKYVFMGDIIGGKPTDPALLDCFGNVDYDKIAATDKFKQGIERLLKALSDGWKIVLLCAEEDPKNCHRHRLIAKVLELEKGITVKHIRVNGHLLQARELFKNQPRQMKLF